MTCSFKAFKASQIEISEVLVEGNIKSTFDNWAEKNPKSEVLCVFPHIVSKVRGTLGMGARIHNETFLYIFYRKPDTSD